MLSNKKTNKEDKIGARYWIIFILVGLAGQFAWSVENMYLNTYIAYLNFNAPVGQEFDYSLMIALTTAFSAITATVTTLLMGGLIDKLNKRKMFISLGYIVWGIATASFGLVNVNNANTLIPISMSALTASIMVIVIDCIMTFFGSTSNDAAFNSYVTKVTKENNRAKVEGVLSILPLVAMLIIFVGLNGLTTKEGGNRWDLFFYIIGAISVVVGIISLFLIPKEPKEEVIKDESYFKLISEGFKRKTIVQNKELYLVLLVYFIYGVATQIYFPYLMVYIEKTCNILNSGDSFLTPFAIVMAISLIIGSLISVLVGFIADKFGKNKMMVPVILLLALGLLLMFFVPMIKDDMGRIIFGAISGTVMIGGYVSVPTIINAMVRSYIPKGKEGTFMGIRMIFVVALPMCIGPFIGDALNKAFGDTFIGEYGVTSVIPSNYNYIVGLVVLILAIIPIIFLMKGSKKNEKEEIK